MTGESFEIRFLRAISKIPDDIPPVRRKREIACAIFPRSDEDHALVQMEYRLETEQDLDLDCPIDFAAKIQWLKFNDRRALYGRMVDKYAARSIVAERWDERVLPEVYEVVHDPKEIAWNRLPPSFVVKATHGWNMNLMFRAVDERPLGPAVVSQLQKWLEVRHAQRHAEWAYSQVSPAIIVEELLQDESGKLPDYKFFCFHGEPRFLKLDVGRESSRREQGYFDLSWMPLPFRNPNVAPLAEIPLAPASLAEMVAIARALSTGIPFVRVDLYEVNGRPKFGEFTLYPSGGNLWFRPESWNDAIGNLLHLDRIMDSTTCETTSDI